MQHSPPPSTITQIILSIIRQIGLRRFLKNSLSLARTAALVLGAGGGIQAHANSAEMWAHVLKEKPPEIFPVESLESGVRAFYYTNVPWKQQPTRVFAYYGVPENTQGRKVPAVVLVHGGLGSAYAEWVRWWNRHGYAAIAMDHCGNVPTAAKVESPYAVERPRHPLGGPVGDGGLGQIADSPKDQWAFHAVSAIIKANTLLRSFPEIDANQIGLCGVSWGGFLTCISAGVDQRFRFVIPVYGCGFVGEDLIWPESFKELSPELQQRWTSLWDPSNFLPAAKMPILWINGTNDHAFSLPLWDRSAALTAEAGQRTLKIDMPHDQKTGGEVPEAVTFANGILGRGKPLAKVATPTLRQGILNARFQSGAPISNAQIHFTLDSGPWRQRHWTSVPARISLSNVDAPLPKGATACFISIIDNRGLTSSSPILTPTCP